MGDHGIFVAAHNVLQSMGLQSQNNTVTQVGLHAEDGRGTVGTKVRQVRWAPAAAE